MAGSAGYFEAADDADLLVTVRPALELGDDFRTFPVLSRDGQLQVPARGLSKPLLLFGVLMRRYRRDTAVPGDAGVAVLGRLRGHRLDR